MSDDKVYKDSDIVWVKLSNYWWPGEVTAVHRQPEGLIKQLKRKPYCVVKFFQEDAYEYVKSAKQIFPFQCNKKDEFIKKGLALYNAKNKFMEKFPSDVEIAERLAREAKETETLIINDRPDSIVKAILGQSMTRRSNDYYDSDYARNSSNHNARRSGDSITKILNITPNHTNASAKLSPTGTSYTLSSRNMHSSAVATPSSAPSTSAPSSSLSANANLYRCSLCDFTSLRQNVIIFHRKTHSGGGNATPSNASSLMTPPKSTPSTTTNASSSANTTPTSEELNSSFKSPLTTPLTTRRVPPQSNADVADKFQQKRKDEISPTSVSAASTQLLPSYPTAPATLPVNNGSAPAAITPTSTARLPKKKELIASLAVSNRMLRSSPHMVADISEITLPETLPKLRKRSKDDKSSKTEITQVSIVVAQTPPALISPKAATPSTPKRNSEEIRQSLLADWSDEEKDDEEDNLQPQIKVATPPFIQPAAVVPSDVSKDDVPVHSKADESENAIVVVDVESLPSATASIVPTTAPLPPTTSNRIRNIPKKDRRDIILKEFNSELAGNSNSSSSASTPPPIVNLDSSNSFDSVVVIDVETPPAVSEPIDVDQLESETIKPTDNDKIESEIQPLAPEPAEIVNDSDEKIEEEIEPSGDTDPVTTAVLPTPTLSCFDFQEEEDNDSDVLTSIANFKKKYLSPDKTQTSIEDLTEEPKSEGSRKSTETKASPQKQQNDDLAEKDQQLAVEIESLLEQTTATVFDMDSVAVTTTALTMYGSSKDEVPVKGLPIKERGKRIFKSRNRSRVEDAPIAAAVGSTEAVVGEVDTAKEIENTTCVEEVAQDVNVDNNVNTALNDEIVTKDSSPAGTNDGDVQKTIESDQIEVVTENHELPQPLDEPNAVLVENQLIENDTHIESPEKATAEEEKETSERTENPVSENVSMEEALADEPQATEVRTIQTPDLDEYNDCNNANKSNIEDEETIPLIKHSPVELYRLDAEEAAIIDRTDDVNGVEQPCDDAVNTSPTAQLLTADECLNELKENMDPHISNAHQQYPAELFNRIQSPTDENSSVGISEAGAEFGSPTSMLDDERFSLLTGNLMTPTEGLTEDVSPIPLQAVIKEEVTDKTSCEATDRDTAIPENADEPTENVEGVAADSVQAMTPAEQIDKIAAVEEGGASAYKGEDSENNKLENADQVHTENDNVENLAESQRESSNNPENENLEKFDASQKSPANPPDVESENIDESPNALVPPSHDELKHVDESPMPPIEPAFDASTLPESILNDIISKPADDDIESPPHEELSGNELEMEMAKVMKSKAIKSKQSAKRKDNHTPTLTSEGNEKSLWDDELPEKPRTRHSKPVQAEVARKSPYEMEEAPMGKRVTRGSLQQTKADAAEKVEEPQTAKVELPKVKSTANEFSRKSNRKLKSPTVEKEQLTPPTPTEDAKELKESVKDAQNKEEEQLEETTELSTPKFQMSSTPSAGTSSRIEKDPLDTSKEVPKPFPKRRSHMKITPTRKRPFELHSNKETTKPTHAIWEKTRKLESLDPAALPQELKSTKSIPDKQSNVLTAAKEVNLEEQMSTPKRQYSENNSPKNQTTTSEEISVKAKSKDETKRKSETDYGAPMNEEVSAATVPVTIAIDSNVSTAAAASTSPLSDIRSFRPRRQTTCNEPHIEDTTSPPADDGHNRDDLNTNIEADGDRAADNKLTLLASATTSPPQRRTPSPIEKVQINLDVANPLSSQIANILATTNSQQQLNAKKRMQLKSTMKRKKSIEDDIPSFIIERPVATTVEERIEMDAVAHVQNMCPQVKITRKEHIIEEVPKVVANTKSTASGSKATTSGHSRKLQQVQQQQPQQQPQQQQQQPQIINSPSTEEATLFDISNIPILLSNEQLPENVHIVFTPASNTASAAPVTTEETMAESPRILHHQIIQNASSITQAQSQQQSLQRQRKPSICLNAKLAVFLQQDSTSDNSHKLEQQKLHQQQAINKQIGIDSRGNKYVIIKTPPVDLVVQQAAALQHSQHSIPAQPKAQSATFSMGSNSAPHSISDSKSTPPALSPTQQQPIPPSKPKSPAAAATGGRKQAGNIITLPTSVTVKQQQQKFNNELGSASGIIATKSNNNKNQQQRTQASGSRRKQQLQRKQGIVTTDTTDGVNTSTSNRLSSTESHSSAKIPKTDSSTGAFGGGDTLLAQQQLLQLQRQQQQQQQARFKSQPPALHPLHNRKPKKQPQQHRNALKKQQMANAAVTNVAPPPLINQLQHQSTYVAAVPQQQQAPQQQLQQSQLQQVQQTQPQTVHSTTFSEEQLMQLPSEDRIDETSKILAVPTQTIPGYNETFLLCTLVNNNYKPIDNVVLYLDHDLNQLVPVPLEALDGQPNLIVNHPPPPEEPINQMQPNLIVNHPAPEEPINQLQKTVEPDSSTQLICLQPIPDDNAHQSLAVDQQTLTQEVIAEAEAAAAQMPVFMPPDNDAEMVSDNAVILNIEGQQIILDAATFKHLLDHPDSNTQLITDDGTEFVLTREVLAALEAQQAAQNAEMAEQLQLAAAAQQLTSEAGTSDILAVALAGSDLYGNEVLEIETTPGLQLLGSDGSSIVFQPPALPQPHLTPPIVAKTNETSTLLNQTPIMSTLEKPSTAMGKRKPGDLSGDMTSANSITAALLATSVSSDLPMACRPNLEDSLAVIGVSTQSSTVPTSLELPITITNPAIAPKVTMATAPNDIVHYQPHSSVVSAGIANDARLYNDPGS